MIRTAILMLAFVPGALVAQSNAGALASMSVDAELAAARSRHLPEAPIRRRVAEGRVKGASETQLAIAAHKVRVAMESGMEAMVDAGHSHPSDEEIEGAGKALERGFTRAHISAIAHAAPSDRSLAVAFDVLTTLNERGVPVGRALAQVQSKLEARQSDTDINLLLNANPQATANVGGVRGSASARVGVGAVIRKP